MLKRIASNATANVVNGIATAAFQIGMTAVMARTGSPVDLPTWALAASIAGFAPLLACNLQGTVARRLTAPRRLLVDGAEHDALVMTASRAVARRLSLFGLAAAVMLGSAVPYLYPKLMPRPAWPASLVVSFFFAGSCWVVFAQPEQGWLMTGHRNWPIAYGGIIARGTAFFTCVLLLLVAGWPSWLAVALCSTLMWSGIWYLRRQMPMRLIALRTDSLANEAKQVVSIARSFAVWNVTSAAIQTSTVPIIGLIAPAAATPFYLAFTLVTILVGAATAAANALVAPVAHMIGSGNLASVERISTRATLLLWGGLMAAFLLVYALLGPVIAAWVGAEHQAPRFDVLVLCFALLALQQGLRSTNIVSAIVLSMGADTRTMLYSPLIEGAGAVLIALPLAFYGGPFAYLVGLAIAGGVGGIVVLWLAVKHSMNLPGESTHGRRLIALVVSLQATTVAIWGVIALISRISM